MTSSKGIPAPPPAEAREIVRSRLEGVAPEVVETVELLTSELVNNAILHGSGVAALVLEVENDRVHVEVHDTDPTLQLAPLRHAPSSVRGRGARDCRRAGHCLGGESASRWQVRMV